MKTNSKSTSLPNTLSGLFRSAVRNFQDRDCIISDCDGSTFSYADVDYIVSRVISKLQASGMKKGEAICIYSPMHVEAFVLFWAVAELGIIFVPADFNWPARILEKVLAEVRPKLLFCAPESMKELSLISPALTSDFRTVLFDSEYNDSLFDSPTFSDWLEESGSFWESVEISPDDEAVILYTSGSSGDPKGVVLSHGALCRSGRLVTKTFGWSSDDIFFNLGEMHTMSGLRSSAVAALHCGCSFLMTSLSKRTNIFSITECIRQYGCTLLGAAPITLRQFAQFKDRIPVEDLRSLKFVLSTGSTLSRNLMEEFHDLFQIPILNYYGLTETTGLCIGNSSQTFRDAQGSIGRAIDCEVAIIDHEDNFLEAGRVGELIVRSDTLMSGYYRREDLTREIIKDGWLHTGDLAMKRPDGHFVLVGRKRNIIKNAHTELIHIEEVELALERHPQVLEAAVCGYVSSLGDERMAAFIVPATESENPAALFSTLRNYIAAELGGRKIPSVFLIRGQLPRSSAGKLLREQLKREMIACR